MQPTIVDSLDEKAWREFVAQHPQGNIFQTPEMFQVLARAKGFRPMLRAAVNNTGEVLALMLPVQITIIEGLLRRLSTRSVVYGSVLCAPDAAGTGALAVLLKAYCQEAGRETIFTELRNLSDLSAIMPVLHECAFVYEDHLDYLIELNCSPEQRLRRIGPRTRKHIRRELQRGQLVVEQVTSLQQVKTCYDLVGRSYKAARVPVADFSMFKAALDVLLPRNMVTFWLARVGDIPVASSAELTYKDMIYGWYAGVDRAYSRHNPSELLMWHVLKWGAENGYRVYDFGGAGTPDEEYGVRDFKSKFGGRLVCHGRNICVHSPNLLRLSKVGYAVYRRLFSG